MNEWMEMDRHSFAERDWDNEAVEVASITTVPEVEPVRTSIRVNRGVSQHSGHRSSKSRRSRDSTFLLPRLGTSRRRSISPPRSHVPLPHAPIPSPAPSAAQTTTTFAANGLFKKMSFLSSFLLM